nr:hypothetical protein [uncultured Flavobacterium sp.]
MRTFAIKYIAEINKDIKVPEKREMLIKEINIVQALEKMAKKVSLYRRILSIEEIK